VIASKFHMRVAGPMLVSGLCFFGGVGLGTVLEAEEHGSEHADGHGAAGHADHDDHGHDHAKPAEIKAKLDLVSISTAPLNDVALTPAESVTPKPDVNQSAMAGLFFGIYYCMTGVHAVHIIGGMLVITWLIVKASREEFHEQYFGPVDNVGLYWHLVDFIWIYLFPLLYLIT
jgi:cytochrome c oxidase subunit III